MKLQKVFFSVILVFLFLFSPAPAFSQKETPELENTKDLEKILQKCAKYCNKLANAALDFVCLEKIKEEILYRHTAHVIPPLHARPKRASTSMITN